MALSIFDDKSVMPDEPALEKGIGRRYTLFVDLRAFMHDSYPNIEEVWLHESKDSGWTLAFRQKKKALLRVIPMDGFVSLVFLFNDKALQATASARMPRYVSEAIASARHYKVGTPFRVDIKTAANVKVTKKLIDIKMAS